MQRIVLLLIIICTSTSSMGDSIRVVGLHFPPYIITEKGKPPKGITVDLVSMALAEFGYQAEFDISNWARAFRRSNTIKPMPSSLP